MCVVKGAGLDGQDARKIFKRRAALDGSWAKDGNYDVALFNEMGSPSAITQAGMAVDAFGLQPQFDIEQADTEAAHKQCDFKGTETWVRSPEDRWLDEWFTRYSKGHRVPTFADPR